MEKLDPVISVENLTVTYKKDTIFHKVSFDIPKSKISVLVGPNGSGKSSILKAIVGDINYHGTIKLFGEDIKRKKRKIISYIPQKRAFDITFPITVFDFVSTGMYSKQVFPWRLDSKQKKSITQVLKSLGINNISDNLIEDISGGQLKKALIARAIIYDGEIIILDEPFNEIDFASEKKIINILRDLCKKGKTIIVVSHDLYKLEIFDYAVLINKRIVDAGPINNVISAENLSKTYNTDTKIFENIINNK